MAVLTPFDLSSICALINVAGTSPPTADMRGQTVQGAQREWGPLEYDTALVTAAALVTPFDLASYCALVNVAGSSPPTADMRGTTVQGAQREWGPLEYDATLLLAPSATDSQTYAWPYDYWPGRYWAEYWPDYGAAGDTIIPLVIFHRRQQGMS